MAALVLDIAWPRPTVATLKATGAVGIIRYFSKDDTKDLHPDEVTAYQAAGFVIGTVYETTTGRAMAGRAAGIADAQDAERQRIAVGLPDTHVHHFAVDTDTTWSAVADYFAGVVSVLGTDRSGCYAGFQVIQGAHKFGIRFLWQTLAWSGGQLSPFATLYQSGGTLLNGDADINKVTSASGDWGQTPRPEDIVTPQDIAAIAAAAATAVWNHGETNAATGQPVRMGAVLAWEDRVHSGQVKTLTAQLAGLSAAVTALAKDGGITAEQITAAAQAGATAALAELGHALDGTH